jgi:hypothetical protein
MKRQMLPKGVLYIDSWINEFDYLLPGYEAILLINYMNGSATGKIL